MYKERINYRNFSSKRPNHQSWIIFTKTQLRNLEIVLSLQEVPKLEVVYVLRWEIKMIQNIQIQAILHAKRRVTEQTTCRTLGSNHQGWFCNSKWDIGNQSLPFSQTAPQKMGDDEWPRGYEIRPNFWPKTFPLQYFVDLKTSRQKSTICTDLESEIQVTRNL